MTEKFEANSKPMRIHVSDPCKMLLDDRYVLEERPEGAELADKVCLLVLLDTNGSQYFILLLNYCESLMCIPNLGWWFQKLVSKRKEK